MDKFLMLIKSIDWIFAGIILIGGRYWGSKYFSISKNKAVNFLGFATAFGIVWLIILYYTVGIAKAQVANLFITFLIVTSFYEILAQRIFEAIENLPFFKGKGGNEKPETVITVKGGEVTDIKEVKPEDKKE